MQLDVYHSALVMSRIGQVAAVKVFNDFSMDGSFPKMTSGFSSVYFQYSDSPDIDAKMAAGANLMPKRKKTSFLASAAPTSLIPVLFD